MIFIKVPALKVEKNKYVVLHVLIMKNIQLTNILMDILWIQNKADLLFIFYLNIASLSALLFHFVLIFNYGEINK